MDETMYESRGDAPWTREELLDEPPYQMSDAEVAALAELEDDDSDPASDGQLFAQADYAEGTLAARDERDDLIDALQRQLEEADAERMELKREIATLENKIATLQAEAWERHLEGKAFRGP